MNTLDLFTADHSNSCSHLSFSGVYFIVLSAVDCVTLPDIILARPFKQATCTKYTTSLSSLSTSLMDEFLYKAKVSDTQRDLPLGRNIVTCVYLRLLSFLPTVIPLTEKYLECRPP